MTWMLWALPLFFGLIGAPWYAPAAISAVFFAGLVLIGVAGSVPIRTLAMQALALAFVVLVGWSIGRGLRALYLRIRRKAPIGSR